MSLVSLERRFIALPLQEWKKRLPVGIVMPTQLPGIRLAGGALMVVTIALSAAAVTAGVQSCAYAVDQQIETQQIQAKMQIIEQFNQTPKNERIKIIVGDEEMNLKRFPDPRSGYFLRTIDPNTYFPEAILVSGRSHLDPDARIDPKTKKPLMEEWYGIPISVDASGRITDVGFLNSNYVKAL